MTLRYLSSLSTILFLDYWVFLLMISIIMDFVIVIDWVAFSSLDANLAYHISLKKICWAHAFYLQILLLLGNNSLSIIWHRSYAFVILISVILVFHIGSQLLLTSVVILIIGLLSHYLKLLIVYIFADLPRFLAVIWDYLIG